MMFEAQLGRLAERWERLSPRERTLLTAAGATFVVMLIIIVGFAIIDGLSTLDERNSDARQALSDLDTQREGYLRAKAKSAQIEARLGKGPVQLQGFLEQVAKDSGIDIPESNEQPQQPAGKQFVERSVDLRLHQVTLESLARFMRGVETGPNLVAVTALRVTVRDDKHQDFDVEMTVSTYEHAAEKKEKSVGKKGDKQ